MSGSDGGRRYMMVFGLESIGAAMIACITLPVYRTAVADPSSYRPNPTNVAWSLAAMIVMQAGYWVRRRLRPQPPAFRNAVLGHVIVFTGRMTFVLATSVFGFVFITRRDEFHLGMPGYVITLLALFCWFCYTQDLQRLGDALGSPEN